MTIDFKNQEIRCFDGNTLKKIHKPISTEFSEIEILKDGRVLIIENYYKYSFNGKSNLYCLNRQLEIEWFLSTPQLNVNDKYVGFSTNGEEVYANTWNAFRVKIDIKNGIIIESHWTK